MSVLESRTECPENQDDLARFWRLSVLETRTSLYYQTLAAEAWR